MPVKKLRATRTKVQPGDQPSLPLLNKVATVPDGAKVCNYKHRTMLGEKEFKVFDFARSAAINVLLVGPTGCGKTLSVMAYAKKRGFAFYAIPCNSGIDPQELIGSHYPDPDTGGWSFVPGGLTDVIEYGGVVLINEINFLPDRISVILFEALDGRRSVTLKHAKGNHVIRAHRPNCWCDLSKEECERRWVLIVGDMNEGYQGTRELNHALRNRFGIQDEWDYHEDIEDALVKSKELLRIARDMRDTARTSGTFITPVSTNMLEEFETTVAGLGLRAAVMNFVTHFATPDEKGAVKHIFEREFEILQKDYRRILKGEDYDPVDDEPEPMLDPDEVDPDDAPFDDDDPANWR